MLNIDNARLAFKGMAESRMRIYMGAWFTSINHEAETVHECGTAACFAGHVVSAIAPDMVINHMTHDVWDADEDAPKYPGSYSTTPAGQAQKLLGLTQDQADSLFGTQICRAHLDQECEQTLYCDVTTTPTLDQLKDIFAAVTKIDRSELD